MRTTGKILGFFAAMILLGLGVPRANAAAGITLDFFYDNLEPYGDWVEVGDYGYCWHPREVSRNWRPYTDGRWVYTDAGWTWVSDEPYGWAVYHYGRWAHVGDIGWVWRPGTEWGPGWVSWRHGPRYTGWAPLPPEARFSAGIGFGPSVDVSFDIGPAYYNFVDVRNFGAPRLRDVVFEPQRNITIINQTTNVTNIRTVNNVVVNEGPRYEVLSAASEAPIQRVKIERIPAVAANQRALVRVEDQALRVPAPVVGEAKPDAKPKKVAARIDKGKIDRGWKDAGPQEEVEKVRAKMKTESVAAGERGSQTTGEVAPKPDQPLQPLLPANEKPSVTGKPEVGEKTTQPSKKGKSDKAKSDKAASVAPGEPSSVEPGAKSKKSGGTGKPEVGEKARPPSKKGKSDKAASIAPVEPGAKSKESSVTGKPEVGEKTTQPSKKGKSGKPVPVVPSEPRSSEPAAKAKETHVDQPPVGEKPASPKKGKSSKPPSVVPEEPKSSAKVKPPESARPDPRVAVQEKAKKSKQPSVSQPAPPPRAASEQARQPKPKKEEAKAPPRSVVPDKSQRVAQGAPPKPDAGTTNPKGKGKKGKDKDKDKDKENP